MTAARFRLAGRTDVLGVWDAVPAADTFGSGPGSSDEEWRVDLPAAGTEAAVGDRAAALGAAEAGIREADRRLAEFGASAGPGGPPAFGAGPGGPGSPEQELAAWVGAVTGTPAYGGSFGWFGGLGDAAHEAWMFLTQTARSLAAAARVETTVGGVVVARTTVGWRGTTATAWRAGAGPGPTAAHLRSVGLALASRRAWVRLAAVLMGGAAGLAARLAIPGGWVSAVPAVWRFVRRVLAEARAARVAG